MLRFQGVKHLISWLERSPEGRELLREQLARMEARPAPRVLAVQHANRTDLYASEPVRFRVVTRSTAPTTSWSRRVYWRRNSRQSTGR